MSNLPKIQYPLITIKIPSTGRDESFRWMLVREEKILLIASETNDDKEKKAAVRQVINNCAVSPTFKVSKLSTFDLEYIFIKIRAASVSNFADISFVDYDDKEQYPFHIDLNTVEVKFPTDVTNSVKINDQYTITFNYPSADLYDDPAYYESTDITDIASKCVDKIFDGDSIIDPKESSLLEIKEFFETLDQNTFANIRKFFYNLPIVYWEDKYVNKNGKEKKVVLASLTDFFTF